jgi:hypothetical protein
VELLRHRQTKEAATDMFYLQSPRHISTLPIASISAYSHDVRFTRAPWKGGAFPVGENPTRQPLQPEATGAVMEVTKWLKPSDSGSRVGDHARVCRP